jgi:hypothetical protein
MPEPASPTFLTRARARLPCDGAEREEVVRELPSIGIVARVLAVTDRVVAEPAVCRDPAHAAGPAAELAAIAAEIAALWGPGGDWFAVADRLDGADARRALRAGGVAGLVRESEHHAWEPMEDGAIAAVVAAVDVATLREASEAWIPFGMWVACVAAASLLRSVEPEPRLTLRDVLPHAWLADQGAHRALVVSALAHLRRLVDAGFPGIATLLRTKAPQQRPVAGPYRAHVAAELPPSPADGARRPTAPSRLGSARLDELFDEALAHALRAALREHAPAELDALPRGVRREQADAAKKAANAERASVSLVRARGVLRVIELGLFPVALHEAVIELHSAAGGFAIEESLMKDPVIRHLARAGRALGAVRSLLGLQLGLRVDATRLAADVVGHLRVVSPRAAADRYEELVHAVSQVLAGTSFVEQHGSLGRLAGELDDAVRGAEFAASRVHWYERVFGDGPGAMERDAFRAVAESARKALATTTAAVRGYVDGALRAVHPQALAYFRTFDLEITLSRVRLEEVADMTSARDVRYAIAGDREFRAHLEVWTGELLRAFGHLPSPGEILETEAVALLDAAQSGG